MIRLKESNLFAENHPYGFQYPIGIGLSHCNFPKTELFITASVSTKMGLTEKRIIPPEWGSD